MRSSGIRDPVSNISSFNDVPELEKHRTPSKGYVVGLDSLITMRCGKYDPTFSSLFSVLMLCYDFLDYF